MVKVSKQNATTRERLIREKLRSLFRAIKFDFMVSPSLQYLDSEGGRLLRQNYFLLRVNNF
jgi:ATP phosphoribosyltransferase regulatory subunit HisZ